jgi:hypothetical protein
VADEDDPVRPQLLVADEVFERLRCHRGDSLAAVRLGRRAVARQIDRVGVDAIQRQVPGELLHHRLVALPAVDEEGRRRVRGPVPSANGEHRDT